MSYGEFRVRRCGFGAIRSIDDAQVGAATRSKVPRPAVPSFRSPGADLAVRHCGGCELLTPTFWPGLRALVCLLWVETARWNG